MPRLPGSAKLPVLAAGESMPRPTMRLGDAGSPTRISWRPGPRHASSLTSNDRPEDGSHHARHPRRPGGGPRAHPERPLHPDGRHGGRSTGMLASWVQQAGFDPPMLTVAVRRDRYVADWIAASGRFTLNQVAAGDKPLLKHFGRGFGPDEAAFDGVAAPRRLGATGRSWPGRWLI